MKLKSVYLNSTFCFFTVFLLLLIGFNFNVEAQGSSFFKTNGRDINIDAFSKEVSKMMDEAGVPGMSLAIIENDEIVFYESYGVRRQGKGKDADALNYLPWAYTAKVQKINKKVTKGTVFNGASLSKTFLVYVVYQLVDEGKLNLDKPMFQYLENERLAHDERYKLITPRMILSHSSGIENWQFQNDFNKLEIVGDPGKDYVYSGEGYDYLAKVVDLIIQEPYEEYIKERVIKPLRLENTYLKCKEKSLNPFRKGVPWNYASAHTIGGGQYSLRNFNPEPAYGNHFTAEDYAKLVLAMFNKDHFTNDRKDDILEPRVKIGSTSVYYGPGFEIGYNKGDTIISHGGDNPGHKNLMFYSPVKKRGFVFMTNSDRGLTMASRLNEMSVGLGIDIFIDPGYNFTYIVQYPSTALSLLKTFDKKGLEGMFSTLEKLKAEKKMDADALNGLAGFHMYYGDRSIAPKLLEDGKALFPNSADTYTLLGEYYLDNANYKLALENFTKGKALNFKYWDIEAKIKRCEQGLSSSNTGTK